MAKSIFEEIGGTYHEENGYLIPDLTLPTEEEKPIGIWGQRHKSYQKERRKATYITLLTSGKLNSYLADLRKFIFMFHKIVNKILTCNRQAVTIFICHCKGTVNRRINRQTYIVEICPPKHQLG